MGTSIVNHIFFLVLRKNKNTYFCYLKVLFRSSHKKSKSPPYGMVLLMPLFRKISREMQGEGSCRLLYNLYFLFAGKTYIGLNVKQWQSQQVGWGGCLCDNASSVSKFIKTQVRESAGVSSSTLVKPEGNTQTANSIS